MNAIIGMTEAALDTELGRRAARVPRRSSATRPTRCSSVINDMLDFSKIEAGKLALDPVDFDLRDSLGDALEPPGPACHAKGLELACDVRPGVPGRLVGDPLRLRQVIVNLVGNAIKFTEQGEVVVR